MSSLYASSDDIRAMFSRAMSDMYRAEVPQYGTLVELVSQVNETVLGGDEELKARLIRSGELARLNTERHGAIRLGRPKELFTIRRLFAVMGMRPVGYYDLSAAGVPVHSTAFRPVDDQSLTRNPFRIFVSLLRLDLISDLELRKAAQAILARRNIFTPRALILIDRFEEKGLTEEEAEDFVHEAIETFRWHSEATVASDVYRKLHEAHPLIADVVCFKGPHINHLTPRTLDIDAVQTAMPACGIKPKAVVEGPPRRKCPILLRQTSFKALEESIAFVEASGSHRQGVHTARFGEVEQRGVALTPKGRALYDRLLGLVRSKVKLAPDGSNAAEYVKVLDEVFAEFPDSYDELRRQELAYFRYSFSDTGKWQADDPSLSHSVDELIEMGYLKFDPIVYEDFLPVSAAGIFQSNLGDKGQGDYTGHASREAFEAALGASVLDELALYAEAQAASLSELHLDAGQNQPVLQRG